MENVIGVVALVVAFVVLGFMFYKLVSRLG